MLIVLDSSKHNAVFKEVALHTELPSLREGRYVHGPFGDSLCFCVRNRRFTDVPLAEFRAIGAVYVCYGTGKKEPLSLKDVQLGYDHIIDDSGGFPKGGKDISRVISKWSHDRRRAIGNALRSWAMPKFSESCGSEGESVVLRDRLRSSIILSGFPPLPARFEKGVLVGMKNFISVEPRSEAWHLESAEKVRKILPRNMDLDGQDFNDFLDGQVKLASLLSGLWRWDEVLCYVGSSPGHNIESLLSDGMYSDRYIICIDPRKTYVSGGCNVVIMDKMFNRESLSVVAEAINAFLDKSGFLKVLLFNDVRSPEAIATESEHNEDMEQARLMNELIQMTNRKNVSFRICAKLKVRDDRVAYTRAGGYLIPQVSRRPLYELRLISGDSPISRCHDTLDLVEWNNLRYAQKCRQSFLLLHLSIVRRDGDSSMQNSLDLFYIPNSMNSREKQIRLVLGSPFSAFYSDSLDGFNDAPMIWPMDILEMEFAKGKILLSFPLVVDLFKLDVNVDNLFLSDKLLIIANVSFLDSINVDWRVMCCNSYSNSQTLSFRFCLNALRMRGNVMIRDIDDFRDSCVNDDYSGHLLGMMALMHSKSRYFSVVRWMMQCVSRNIADNEFLRSNDDQPECRSGQTQWHSDVELYNTMILAVTMELIRRDVVKLGSRDVVSLLPRSPYEIF